LGDVDRFPLAVRAKLCGGAPRHVADRLVAAEFAVKFQNDLSVKRRTKLYGHAISPKLPTRRCTAARISSRCLARLCTREIGDKVPTTWLTERPIACGATRRAGDRATLRELLASRQLKSFLMIYEVPHAAPLGEHFGQLRYRPLRERQHITITFLRLQRHRQGRIAGP
jgi:hypothetical protein